MPFIDVAIPAIIGLVTLVWPRALFYGSRATPDDKKICLIRGGGVVLLVVAILYLGINLRQPKTCDAGPTTAKPCHRREHGG